MTRMNRPRLPFILLVAGGLLAPSAVSGQTADTIEPATVAAAPETASEAPTAAEQLRPFAAGAALLPPVQARVPFEDVRSRQEIEIDDGDDRGVPFMIAGGILFVAGAIAGGDAGTILMLGGAAAGAYGAFVYFGGD
jgi:hypothetical protein